ncbi:hypothetical protein HDV57DRAFT_11585 [Trichoderma longibrachiatum]
MYMLQPVSAWRHFLQALAYWEEFDVVVQAARKTQAPTTAPIPSPAEVNLYWACWRAEMDLRLCLGPLDFQTQDRVYTESLPDVSVNPFVDVRVRLFYSAEIALLKLTTRARNDIGQVLASCSEGNDVDREIRLVQAVALHSVQVKAWLDSLPQAMDFRKVKLKSDDFDIYRFTLCCRCFGFCGASFLGFS